MTAMKFLFADSQDYIDPGFDFHKEEYSPDRMAHRDDVYPHEFFDRPPYDGMLVSRATVGDERKQGKYSTSQSIRFRREGAANYLRYQGGGMIMGDCGAFSYVHEAMPPYTVPEIVDYYTDCGFTHAVSIDHVILSYNESYDRAHLFGGDPVPEPVRFRYDLTLRLAQEFWDYCQRNEVPFVPIGVAQGWSPCSYAQAVNRLVNMGYGYVALGGMVPLKVEQIHHILTEVRSIQPDVKLHLFGFTKADHIGDFTEYGITSFDSTSPMLRAFKDDTKNYLGIDGKWYCAVRVPQADENNHIKASILAGFKNQRQIRIEEAAALAALRAYSRGDKELDETMPAVVSYEQHLNQKARRDRSSLYRQTLEARAWEHCDCRVCREAGIEVVIFRGSNRNRRRGFHNLRTFHEQLRTVRGLAQEITT